MPVEIYLLDKECMALAWWLSVCKIKMYIHTRSLQRYHRLASSVPHHRPCGHRTRTHTHTHTHTHSKWNFVIEVFDLFCLSVRKAEPPCASLIFFLYVCCKKTMMLQASLIKIYIKKLICVKIYSLNNVKQQNLIFCFAWFHFIGYCIHCDIQWVKKYLYHDNNLNNVDHAF